MFAQDNLLYPRDFCYEIDLVREKRYEKSSRKKAINRTSK